MSNIVDIIDTEFIEHNLQRRIIITDDMGDVVIDLGLLGVFTFSFIPMMPEHSIIVKNIDGEVIQDDFTNVFQIGDVTVWSSQSDIGVDWFIDKEVLY